MGVVSIDENTIEITERVDKALILARKQKILD